MQIKVSDQIFEKYPELQIGVVIAKGIDNSGYDEEIGQMIRNIEQEKRDSIDSEKVVEIPTIARWREVYKGFGAKPSKYRNSVEALIKRILKTELYKINSLVDIYNYISIKHVMTAGGEDLEKIEGDLILDYAKGDEEFLGLGADEVVNPFIGEIVYKDDKGVICRCWNYREADRTKLTENTKNAVVVVENLLPEKSEDLKLALSELKELIKRYCKGECEIKIINKENPYVTL